MLVYLKELFSLSNEMFIYVRYELSIHEIVPFEVFLFHLTKKRKKKKTMKNEKKRKINIRKNAKKEKEKKERKKERKNEQKANSTHFLWLWEVLCCKGLEF